MTLQANIWKYYIIRIFIKRMIVPILLIYLLANGLNPTQIGLLFFIGTLTSLILEIPSGYIADKIGHKPTIVLSLATQAFSMYLYAIGDSFSWFLGATVTFWLGNALWSGTGSAFLYETLKDLSRADDYEKVEGQVTAVSQFISMALLVAVSFLYVTNHQLPFFLSAGFFAICTLLALTLTQPSYHKTTHDNHANILKQDWSRIVAVIGRNRRLTSTVLFFTTWGAIQDALDEFMQLYFQFLRIPSQYFGFIYAANRGLHGLGALYGHRLKNVPITRIMANFGIQLGVFFLLAASIRHYIGAILFPLRNITEGISGPLYEGHVHREITQGDRITLMSIGNFWAGLAQALTSLLLGFLFDSFNVPSVFAILGLASSIVLGGLYLNAKIAATDQ